jgi:hypothetical protein
MTRFFSQRERYKKDEESRLTRWEPCNAPQECSDFVVQRRPDANSVQSCMATVNGETVPSLHNTAQAALEAWLQLDYGHTKAGCTASVCPAARVALLLTSNLAIQLKAARYTRWCEGLSSCVAICREHERHDMRSGQRAAELARDGETNVEQVGLW